MFQVDTRHFASDALEDAMRLAQTKALNSYTFSDCLSFLNYAWSDIYSRMANIDDGYYGTNVKLTNKLTRLPPFIKNSIQVYSAQSPVGYDRLVYRDAGATDMTSSGVYKISGNDLYCPDAERKSVWLYYIPACPQVFFTHHNRDPKLYENTIESDNNIIWGHNTIRNVKFNLFILDGYDSDNNKIDITSATRDKIMSINKWTMTHRGTGAVEDITDFITAAPMEDEDDGKWILCYVSCDYPYIFVTYEHSLTKEHISGFFDSQRQFNKYNPFDFTGRNSDVEYIDCHWNDKSGMSVFIKDWNDFDENNLPKIKELGWTPDTQLDYPIPEMYRYLVARLADKFAALNESNIMGVQKELVEAKYAFESYLDRDKSAWKRITNVNPPTMGDWL